jgi:hypothetical protein
LPVEDVVWVVLPVAWQRSAPEAVGIVITLPPTSARAKDRASR